MENTCNTSNDIYEAVLNVRITVEMVQELAAHRKATLIPTAALVRRAIERELARPVVDAEPVERSASRPPVLFVQKVSE